MSKITPTRIPLGALLKMRQVCAWGGCRESVPMGAIPKDWRWLSLWWGKIGEPPWAPGCIEDRDCVLCPIHAPMLESYLKDIGQRLRETEGSA